MVATDDRNTSPVRGSFYVRKLHSFHVGDTFFTFSLSPFCILSTLLFMAFCRTLFGWKFELWLTHGSSTNSLHLTWRCIWLRNRDLVIFDLSISCIQHTGQTFLTSFVKSRSALVANIWPCEVHGPLHSWFTSKIGDTVHKSFEDSNHGVVNGFYEVFFSLTQKLPKLEQQTSWRISATGVQSEHSVSSDKRSAEKIQNTGGWRKRETGVCAALCNLTIITRYRSCC